MNITIHRGTRQIGGSCVEISSGDTRIIIDIGIPLTEPDGSPYEFDDSLPYTQAELYNLGVLPQVPGLYSDVEVESKVDAVLISHAHPDHYGFLNYVIPGISLWMGEATEKMIRIQHKFFHKAWYHPEIHHFSSGKSIRMGSLSITPFLVDHSIFDSYAFVIEGEGKTIVYSGDFRDHGRKPGMFRQLVQQLPKHVDVLLLEGTHMGNTKRSRLEKEVEEELVEEINQCRGIVYASFSVQNIDRLVSFYKAALRTGRTLLIDPYAAWILDTLKDFAVIPVPGQYNDLKVLFPERLTRYLQRVNTSPELLEGFRRYEVTIDEIFTDRSNYILLARDSMLDELKEKWQRQNKEVTHDDIWIWSLWQGYLDMSRSKKLKRFLKRYDISLKHIHTGGHADIPTLRKVVSSIDPDIVVPIHTNRPEGYKELFEKTRLLEDGESFVF